jgi:hypothetical protein
LGDLNKGRIDKIGRQKGIPKKFLEKFLGNFFKEKSVNFLEDKMQKDNLQKTILAVASPKMSIYTEYVPFSKRMGIVKIDKKIIKQMGIYTVEVEYNPIAKDSFMAVYERKEVKGEWKDVELGYVYGQKDGTYIATYNVDDMYRQSLRTSSIKELNWILTMQDDIQIIDEEIVQLYESYRVAFRLKNSK